MGYDSGGDGPGDEGAIDDGAEEDRGEDHEREWLEKGFDHTSVRETTAPENEVLTCSMFDIKSRIVGFNRACASTCGGGFESDILSCHNDLCFLVVTLESRLDDCGFCSGSNLNVALARDNGWFRHLFAIECCFADEEENGHEKGGQHAKADDVEILDT